MKLITKNKFAYLDYDIQQTFDAWIILKWHEVKSIRHWNVNIKDAMVKLQNSEIFILNLDIPLYEKTAPQTVPWYEQKWARKLLLNKKEIIRLAERTTKTWLVIIPLEVYMTKERFVKIKIWLWKLRKKIEKKQILKERDIDKEAKRDIKNLKYSIW
jgi:SsrA-binding protein